MEEKMRKKLAVILCTAMTVTALAGCGQSGQTAQENSGASQENAQEQEEAGEEPAEEQADAQPSGDVLTIEFFQQKGEEGPQKGYQAIIDKFNAENPDIVIEMNTVPDAGTVYSGYFFRLPYADAVCTEGGEWICTGFERTGILRQCESFLPGNDQAGGRWVLCASL